MASEIQRVRARAMTHARKAQEIEQGFMRKATVGLTGAAYGLAALKGVRREIGGVPIKLLAATGATVAELMTRGPTRRFLSAVADASIATYCESAMRTQQFVAGIEEVEGVEEVSGGGI